MDVLLYNIMFQEWYNIISWKQEMEENPGKRWWKMEVIELAKVEMSAENGRNM